MMKRCACILLVEFRRRFGCVSDEHTATTIIQLGNFGCDNAEIQKEIANMMNCGTRYINLDSSLGIGASLFLGNEVPESMYVFLCMAFCQLTFAGGPRFCQNLDQCTIK